MATTGLIATCMWDRGCMAGRSGGTKNVWRDISCRTCMHLPYLDKLCITVTPRGNQNATRSFRDQADQQPIQDFNVDDPIASRVLIIVSANCLMRDKKPNIRAILESRPLLFPSGGHTNETNHLNDSRFKGSESCDRSDGDHSKHELSVHFMFECVAPLRL